MPLSCRRGAASVIFAIAIIPILGLCGLAVDYGLWARINSNLNMAANSAALNAVKIAANGELNNDPNYKAEGTSAGLQWFLAEAGSGNLAYLAGAVPSVNIDANSKVTATVTFSGTVNSIFGHLFGVAQYPITGNAVATVGIAPYTEVVIAVDDSSSMDIAATPDAINTQATKSACDPTNAYYWSNTAAAYADQSAEYYYNYACVVPGYPPFNGATSVGTVNCPAATQTNEVTPASATFTQAPFPQADSSSTGQSCKLLGQVNNHPVIPGPPCAFACHWDGSKKAGLGNDLWAEARRNNVSLRFDLIKNATQTTLQQMQANNVSTYNNLSVGIYTFDYKITQIYPDPTVCTQAPPVCEAGSDFATAEAKVGYPPNTGSNSNSLTDSGIQPIVGVRSNDPAHFINGNNDDTAFPEDMNALATQFTTPSGNGLTAKTPQKVLILVTDGFQDDPYTRERKAFDPAACQQFKNNGYQVYVVYTPYYPVFHYQYLVNNWAEVTQGAATDPISIAYNLTACSSQSLNNGNTYYISAANQQQLTNALLGFLKEILNSPARFTE